MSTLVERLEAEADSRRLRYPETLGLLREAAAALRATTGEGEMTASLVREAAEILRTVGMMGVELPANWRWPLIDELFGTAAIMEAAAHPPPLRDAGAVLERGTRVTVVRGAHRGRSGVIHEVDGHAANVCLDGIYGPKRFAIVDLSWRTHPAPAQVDEAAVERACEAYHGPVAWRVHLHQRSAANKRADMRRALAAAAKEVDRG